MNKLQLNLKRNSYIFIQENAFENVWEMAAICPSVNVLTYIALSQMSSDNIAKRHS